MRILLTGATGFVGRHLLPRLAAAHDVIALARRPVEGVESVTADLSRPLHRSALPGRVDAVVHLAQSAHYREFPQRADDIFALNVRATFDLLDYARAAGAGAFVYASSGGVYGQSDEPLREEAPPAAGLDFYLTSKQAGELLVQGYRDVLRAVSLRLFFVYGPGQGRMLVHRLAEQVMRGEEIRVEGDPGIRLNPIFVDDAVRVFEPALGLASGGVFNVAGRDAVTLTELVRMIAEQAGCEANIVHSPAGSDGGLVADISRMREVLGVTPETSLREGLGRVVEAARSG